MAFGEWTIELTAGNGFKAPLTFRDENGALVDLTGANVRFLVDDGAIEWSTANSRVVTTGLGTAELTLSAVDVTALAFTFADYVWRIVWSDNTADDILEGKVWKHN